MESARDPLHKVVADALRRMPAEEAPLAAWEFAAGKAVAEKTRAVAFRDGVLTIEVADATWRSQLCSMTYQFLSELNRYSPKRVEKLEFVVKK